MTIEERVREMHDRTVQELVDAHRQRRDEPLVLAVRYRVDDPENLYLLEVLGGFPGGDDDELMENRFEPSAHLRMLGELHLVLGSPAQLRAALGRKDPELSDVRRGTVLADDGSEEAKALRRELGL